jgi:hypothetical protein
MINNRNTIQDNQISHSLDLLLILVFAYYSDIIHKCQRIWIKPLTSSTNEANYGRSEFSPCFCASPKSWKFSLNLIGFQLDQSQRKKLAEPIKSNLNIFT